jgi:hypothetical protein
MPLDGCQASLAIRSDRKTFDLFTAFLACGLIDATRHTEIFQYKFSFAIAKRPTAAQAEQLVLATVQGWSFNAHQLVICFAGRALERGHIWHAQ